MPFNNAASDFFMDPRGHVVERMYVGGEEVHVHYGDIPESDITTLNGIRLTTPLRTVIDIAPTVDESQLALMVQDCLDRGLFTVEEAWARIAEPDMGADPGAAALAHVPSDFN